MPFSRIATELQICNNVLKASFISYPFHKRNDWAYPMDTATTAIQARLAKALHRAGRSHDDCALIAVSKTKPTALIDAARAQGLTTLGKTKSRKPQKNLPP